MLWTATLDKCHNETNLWNFETVYFLLYSSYSAFTSCSACIIFVTIIFFSSYCNSSCPCYCFFFSLQVPF